MSSESLVNIDNDKWNAKINNGVVSSNGFQSSDISTDKGSLKNNISGDINGKFYGSTGDSVGGKFNLSSEQDKVKAVFGAKSNTPKN